MDTKEVKELIVTHSKGSDRAVGRLEVCALTLIHFFRSKVAAAIVLVIALSIGAISASDLELMTRIFSASSEEIVEQGQ